MHFDTSDIIVTVDMIEDYTQVSSLPQHSEPLPLIEYMVIMGARCKEKDHWLRLALPSAVSIALDDGFNITF